MGLLNALQTSVSGMNAQSSYLSAVGDNIANSSTVGYKQATVDFETVLGEQTPSSYESGGVQTVSTYDVTGQGTATSTNSVTDLAIEGQGFFPVTNGGTGTNLLTRAGSFVPNTTGDLVNSAGYTLMGYAADPSAPSGFNQSTFVPINVSTSTVFPATQTSSGTLTGNLPTGQTTGTTYTSNSFTVYDSVGDAVPLTASYELNSDGTWAMNVTDSTGTSVGSATLSFNASTGTLSSGSPISISNSTLNSDNVGNFASPISVDISGLTEVAADFSNTATLNGNATSQLASVKIGTNGTVTGVFANGSSESIYQIPVANVVSPDNLTSLNGDVYQITPAAGTVNYSTAGTGAAGTINSGELEGSTVDLATQLTDMIVAQSSYEANSKVLQTVSNLLSKLNEIQTS